VPVHVPIVILVYMENGDSSYKRERGENGARSNDSTALVYRLNVHLGLSNLEGSYIEVADDVQVWSTESSFVVDDAYDRYEATPGQCAPGLVLSQ
jgi:hypothetical protein